jgi:RimJ/RimL family protein N-acetyltransferase
MGDVEAASRDLAIAIPVGLPDRTTALFGQRLADLREQPWAAAWLLRAVVLRTDGRPLVGLAGFHHPPDVRGAVEIGYETEPGHRRRGYATEAAGALSAWALANGARRVIAAIRPDNRASIGVATRLGFERTGSRWDAVDGTAVLYELRTPVPDSRAKMVGQPGQTAPEP